MIVYIYIEWEAFMKHKLLKILIVSLFFSMIFFASEERNCAAAEGRTIYTAATGSTSDNSGNGTAANPYNLFDTALKNAKDGDTICILSPMGFLNASDNSPYIINKAVTIKGNGNVFLVRAAGLVLTADVTFEDVVLSFGNRYHDAIFANGHTLTLKNVICEEGTRRVDIFCGGLYMNGRAVAPSGNSGKIIINNGGQNFGNIYAGAMNGDFNGDVDIELSNLNYSSEMTVNVSGADETYVNVDDFFNLEEPAPPTVNPNHSISGNVNITMSGTNIKYINGVSLSASGTSNLAINTNGKYNGVLEVENIDAITVKGGGVFAPAKLTGGTTVNLTGGSALDLSAISNPVVSKLVSEGNNNKLVLGRTRYLEISESVQGNFIFETESGYNGHSGMAEYDFAYIRVRSGATVNGSFSYTCIPGLEMTLDKITNYNTYPVAWKTSEASECHPFAINGLHILNPVIAMTVSEFYHSPTFDMEVSVSGNVSEGYYYFDLVPIKYEVVYNNVKYTAETEFDGMSYVAHIPELRLSFAALSYEDLSDAGINVYMYMDGSNNNPTPPGVGTYEITIMPLSEGEQIRKQATLIIMEDSDSANTENRDTVTEVSVSVQNGYINDKITITGNVRYESREAALNAETVLYINGRQYTGGVKNTASGTVSYIVQATPENGFIVGDNYISIVYKGGSSGQIVAMPSESSAYLKLNQVTPKLQITTQNKNTVFNGIQANYPAGNVNITDSNGNVLKSGIVPIVIYKQNGQAVRPIHTGTYYVYYRVEDDFYGTLEGAVGKLVITAAKPNVNMTYSVSGTKVTLKVLTTGVNNIYIPEGKIVFYNGNETVGQCVLNCGEAVFTKDFATGTHNIKAKYEPVYGTGVALYQTEESDVVKVTVKEPSPDVEVEEPTTDGTPSEQPTTDKPTTEDSSSERPTTDIPSPEQPTTGAPSPEHPTTDKPTTEHPTTDKPSSEEPTTENSSSEQQATEDSSSEQQATDAPSSEQSTTASQESDEPSEDSNSQSQQGTNDTSEQKTDRGFPVPAVIAIVITCIGAVGGITFFVYKRKH